MSGKGRKGAELWAHAQAAEKAAAQSNREISGYRIESISLTHERQEHYLRKHVGLPGPSAPLAGLQQGGSSGLAEGFAGYASADQLGAVSGFPSQLVRLLLLHPINLTTSCCLPACSRCAQWQDWSNPESALHEHAKNTYVSHRTGCH